MRSCLRLVACERSFAEALYIYEQRHIYDETSSWSQRRLTNGRNHCCSQMCVITDQKPTRWGFTAHGLTAVSLSHSHTSARALDKLHCFGALRCVCVESCRCYTMCSRPLACHTRLKSAGGSVVLCVRIESQLMCAHNALTAGAWRSSSSSCAGMRSDARYFCVTTVLLE